MLLDGYSTKDFARKHRFTEKHMTRLLNIRRGKDQWKGIIDNYTQK